MTTPPDIPNEPYPPTEGGPNPDDDRRRVPLVNDFANVMTIVERGFVGPIEVRAEIARVLSRYADEELIRIDQLTADREFIAGMVRDAFQASARVEYAERVA